MAAKSEVEECLFNVQTCNKGVQLIIIVNNNGVPIRWVPANTPYEDVVHHASLITELAHLSARSVNDLDPMNDWTFLRVRSEKHEIMVCPEKDFMMIVLQDPNIDDKKVDEKA